MNRHMVPESQLSKPLPTREQYDEAFRLEREQEYPVVDALERELGWRCDRFRLESAARVLACPVKMRPPCWQHGRVVYSVLAQYVAAMKPGSSVFCLDVGTAKGFSALCAEWACREAGDNEKGVLDWWDVVSLDVLDPSEPTRRNSVMDVDGPCLLRQYLEAWPEASHITFLRASGGDWLRRTTQRVHFAFLDGKHRRDHVAAELGELSRLQRTGDLVVLDDLQIPGVFDALCEHSSSYDYMPLTIREDRSMAVARKN